MNVIEIENVSKAYQRHLFGRRNVVFENMNLTVKQGEVIVLQGENGAGKTTLMSLMMGLQKPTSGSIQLFGISPENPASRLRVGCMLQRARVPNNLHVGELIDLFRSYYPQPLATEDILKRASLESKPDDSLLHRRYDPVSKLSGGQEQALYFALAIAGNPDLLLLDEPTNNLSKEACKNFWKQVEELSQQGKTVVVITHDLPNVEEIPHPVTRILTLKGGQLQEVQTERYAEWQKKQAEISGKAERSQVSYQPLSAFAGQFKVELLQLIRKPSLLGFIFALCCLVILLKGFENPASFLTGIAAFSLLLIVLERFSVGIANDRTQGWVKLLRITPLSPNTYLLGKVAISLLIAALGLGLMFGLGIYVVGVSQPSEWWFALSSTLLVGLLPFTAVGFAIGYLFDAKSNSIVSAILLGIALLTGMPIYFMPQSWQSWLPFSPFYHYSQLVLWAGNIQVPNVAKAYDGYLEWHILWLVWTTAVAWAIAIQAYERDGATS